MNKIVPVLLTVALFSGCASAPTSSVSSSEVIGADYDKPAPMPSMPPAIPVAKVSTSPQPPLKMWTVNETRDWYAMYLRTEKGDERGLLYQGSDVGYHYFAARIPSSKSWIRIAIAKSELTLDKEKPDRSAFWPPHGYGFVDPSRNFALIPHTGSP